MQQPIRRDKNEQIILGTVVGSVLKGSKKVSFEVETVEYVYGKKFVKVHTVFTTDPAVIIQIDGLKEGDRVYIEGVTTPIGDVCIKNYIPVLTSV